MFVRHLSFPWSRCFFLKAAHFKWLRHFSSLGRLLFPYNCYLYTPSLCCLNVANYFCLKKKKNPQDLEIHFSVNTFMFRRHLHSKRFSNIQKRCTYKFHGAGTLMHHTCSPGLGGGCFLDRSVTYKMCEIGAGQHVELAHFQAYAHRGGWPALAPGGGLSFLHACWIRAREQQACKGTGSC